MKPFRIVNARIVTSQAIVEGDLLIDPPYIVQVGEVHNNTDLVFDAKGNYVLPGAIDLHVHFRQPGLEHKATIETESRAALRGGVTSFIDMPNTKPETTTSRAWKEKMKVARNTSWINYAFYPGVTPQNINELPNWTEHRNIPAVKAFLARSTGDLLISMDEFEKLLKLIKVPVAVHSELDSIVMENIKKYYGKFFPDIHYYVRPPEACYKATDQVIKLSEKYGKQVHILHLSTKEEVEMLRGHKPETVSIETCPQYLFFDSQDYSRLGNWIKCNPSIKQAEDKKSLLQALNSVIDTIGTDHAPHLVAEKVLPYWRSPSGIPSVELLIPLLTSLVENGIITWTRLVQLTATNPARIYKIHKRGDIAEGMYADIIVLERSPWTVKRSFHKCGWNPYFNWTLPYKIKYAFVNGSLAYREGDKSEWLSRNSMPLEFRVS
ncbi:MAG: amidohydrolase family protein [Chlorobi bacterium]|nr:amidohydrolase family protein [Chlorobiota bacterium]